MSAPGPVDPSGLRVRGGYGGVEARYEDVELLAGLFDRAGDGLRADAWDDKGIAANGDLVESSVLSPATFADAEEAVLAATVGPHGLAFKALGLEVDAIGMRTGVKLLRGTDQLQHEAFEAIDYLGGRALGATAPFALVGGALFLASNPELALLLYQNRGPIGSDLQRFLQDHPELRQHLINGGGGLLDGLEGDLPPGVRELVLHELGLGEFHGSPNDAAGDLAGLLGNPSTDVDVAAANDSHDLASADSLHDLMANLDATNAKADGDIDIVKLGEGPDARYVVNLPGTDSWGNDPGDVRDLESNLQLVAGDDTAYTRGIELALQRAGVPPGAPVALVGHSQGGMAAMHLAADPDFSSRYDVKHVITAGSPTAQVPSVPDHTQVLSLENSGDVVPSTDGEDNPDAPNRTTVTFDAPQNSVGANHAIATYEQGASAADASQDPSITHELDQLRADGFLTPHQGSTQTFTITRPR